MVALGGGFFEEEEVVAVGVGFEEGEHVWVEFTLGTGRAGCSSNSSV